MAIGYGSDRTHDRAKITGERGTLVATSYLSGVRNQTGRFTTGFGAPPR